MLAYKTKQMVANERFRLNTLSVSQLIRLLKLGYMKILEDHTNQKDDKATVMFMSALILFSVLSTLLIVYIIYTILSATT